MVRTVSQWVFDTLLADMESRDEQATQNLYRRIQGTSNAAEFRERLWERLVHKHLRSISKPTKFHIYSLADRNQSFIIEFSSDVLHENFGTPQVFGGVLASSVKNNRSCYLKPLNRNFATFDSFLYQPGFDHPGFQPLLGLQMTDALHHDINLKDLQRIRTACQTSIPQLKALRPSAQKKWIIIFVVPETIGATFLAQKIKDESKHWESKTAQYILQVPETVWKAVT
jgi:hypothetical protein